MYVENYINISEQDVKKGQWEDTQGIHTSICLGNVSRALMRSGPVILGTCGKLFRNVRTRKCHRSFAVI